MERFVDEIMGDVPGCPEPTIKKKVLDAAIQFCNDTWIWQKRTPISIASGEASVLIPTPDNAMVAGLRNVEVSGVAFHGFTREVSQITLDDACSHDFVIDADVAFKPARNTTTLPDILLEDWFDAVASKAKVLLMIQPAKTWSNPVLAGSYETLYQGYVGTAKVESRRKNDITDMKVSMRPFI